jgi:iron complex outermembrane receptor protein
VEVVSSDGIAKSGARDVMDAVERTTGVFVRHIGGGNPAMTQVSMRGYGENSAGRVLVVADGEVLNNMDMSAPDFSRLPLASVDRIEVLHGPQTVLHGANASAGMINFVMAEPEYSQKSVFEIHGGNWNTIGGSAATRGGDEEARVSYRAGASWEHSDGYRDNSGFDLWRANGGVRKDFENGSRLKISSFYSDS